MVRISVARQVSSGEAQPCSPAARGLVLPGQHSAGYLSDSDRRRFWSLLAGDGLGPVAIGGRTVWASGQPPLCPLEQGGGCTLLPLLGLWGVCNTASVSNGDAPPLPMCSLILPAPSGITALLCAETGCHLIIPAEDPARSRRPGESRGAPAARHSSGSGEEPLQSQAAAVTPLSSTNFIKDEAQLRLLSMDE